MNSNSLCFKFMASAVTFTCLISQVTNASAQNLSSLRQDRNSWQETLDAELLEAAAYVIFRPKASAAVFGTATGALGALSNDLPSNARLALAAAGIFAVDFCFQPENRSYCADATRNLTRFASNITSYQSEIDSLSGEIERINRSRLAPGKREIYIDNDCSREINVLVRYHGLDENWRTGGWWNFSPNESSYIVSRGNKVVTLNNNVYIYAEIKDTNQVWSGEHTRYFDGRDYGMQLRELSPDSQGDLRIGFSCPNL